MLLALRTIEQIVTNGQAGGLTLRPEAYGRRRGGYLDRRQTPAADAEPIRRAPGAAGL